MRHLQQSLLEILIDVKDAASILGVSTATVRNWSKADHLKPAGGGRPLKFRESQVRQLKEDIENGKVSRLGKRANKTMSKRSNIHDELLPSRESAREIQSVLDLIRSDPIPEEASILCLAAAFATQRLGFALHSLVEPTPSELSTLAQTLAWTELRSWCKRLNIDASLIVEHGLSQLPIPMYSDFLGSVYQAMQAEGDKSKLGVYFTPSVVVESMVNDNLTTIGPVLDPGCGTGTFLIAALKALLALGADRPLDLLYGVDIDPVATSIARLNLVAACPERLVSAPSVVTGDALAVLQDGSLMRGKKFQYVFSNPPWGANKNSRENQSSMLVSSTETFSQFLALSIHLLLPSGRLSFVLPEAILNIKAHEAIRALVLSAARIRRIRELGRAFTGVFTPTIRLDLEKSKDYTGKVLIELSDGVTHEVGQNRFRSAEDSMFEIHRTDKDASILAKFRDAEHFFMAGQADWALGIVTGNNKKFLRSENHNGELEPIYRGRDVLKYRLGDPTQFLHFDRGQFQQVAPTDRYRAPEKLIYRFISRHLCFAYDDQQRLTLNSANIMIPRNSHISTKCLLALLNSAPVQFYFQKTFSPLKVLRSHIERIPLPRPDSAQCSLLETLAEKMISDSIAQSERVVIQARIDDLVMDVLDLSTLERTAVRQGEAPKKMLV